MRADFGRSHGARHSAEGAVADVRPGRLQPPYQRLRVRRFFMSLSVQLQLHHGALFPHVPQAGVPAGPAAGARCWSARARLLGHGGLHLQLLRILSLLFTYTSFYKRKKQTACNRFHRILQGGGNWTAAMPWPGQEAFNNTALTPWTINGQLVRLCLTLSLSLSCLPLLAQPHTAPQAGYIKTVQGFSWFEVLNAGHMVPYDQPQVRIISSLWLVRVPLSTRLARTFSLSGNKRWRWRW
jgi:hypothetical protein